jgi:hypothetical protein
MTQRIKKIYEGRDLLTQEVIDQNIVKAPRAEIIVIKGPNDSPSSVPQRGYDCVYWHSYVDNLNASQEEKQWLKFAMKLESGCNAESNSNQYYKGLLQWDPCLWYKQFPNENIFDGEAQIKRSLQKLRNGADPSRMWPNVYSRYVEKYGALSWLD